MKSTSVVIHPLVLLSAVDHYKRKGVKRVVGILLGSDDGEVHISDSFASVFEEDTDGWFLDNSYVQNMFDLFYKVNSKAKIVGWYHTGPNMCDNDLEITKSLTKFVTEPYMVIINVHLNTSDLPVQSFKLENNDFIHVNSSIEAEEAEEVGVEYLIRDIREEASGSASAKIKEIKDSLIIYSDVLDNIQNYLGSLIERKAELNQEIVDLCQEILNSVPKLNGSIDESQADVYIAELTKSVIALNDLKRNRIENDGRVVKLNASE